MFIEKHLFLISLGSNESGNNLSENDKERFDVIGDFGDFGKMKSFRQDD